jgi:multiple sugar transport system substrate-binding protein
MKKSLLLLTALLVIFSLVLVACGGGAEAPAEEMVEEPAAPAEKVKIRWFVGLGTGDAPEQVEIEQKVVDEFNATHDNIELILEVVPYDSARDTLSTQIAAGNGPDLIGPVGIGGSNDFYGQYMDLSPLMEAANYDTSIFNEALVEFYQEEDGQVGLPWMVFPSALYYQKEMFDEAGLNYPPANLGDPYVWADGSEAEWSWETLTEVAKFLTVDVNGLTPYDEGFDRESIVQVGYEPQWASAQTIGTFYEPGLLYEGEEGAYTAVIPAAWQEAWEWRFDGMWGDEPFMATGALSGSPEFGGGNVFNSGKAAMGVTQLWYTCCLGDAGESWDVAAFPSYNGVVHGRMDADTLRMWKGSEHPTEAFEVLTYLIGPEGTVPLVMGEDGANPAYGAFPAITELQGGFIDAKAAQYPFVENWDVFLQGLDYPDSPSSEAWMPNILEANNRVATFADLMGNDGTIDFDAELEQLRSDLDVIFNK